MPQVPSEFYSPDSYDELHRWISYWYQIRAVISTTPQSVLEIGSGSSVVSHYLRDRLKSSVTTFDFDPSLAPDVVGDIRQLAKHFEPGSFDCVCAFQVLEHLPFENFQDILFQMSRVSRRSVLFSLPHWGYPIQLRFQFFRRAWTFVYGRKIARPYTWQFDGQHYWEIGTKGCSLQRIISIVKQALNIERHYFCPDYPYHYFFECSPLKK